MELVGVKNVENVKKECCDLLFASSRHFIGTSQAFHGFIDVH